MGMTPAQVVAPAYVGGGPVRPDPAVDAEPIDAEATDELSVAVLTNAPAPYRTDFFNTLARRCRLVMVFDTLREPDRDWVIDEDSFAFSWLVTRGVRSATRSSAIWLTVGCCTFH